MTHNSPEAHGPGRTCTACYRPMLASVGCIPRPNAMTRRQEVDYLRQHGWTQNDLPVLLDRCWDCGATIEGYHHPYCCKAVCLEHGQRLMCDCDFRETGVGRATTDTSMDKYRKRRP